MLVQGPFHLGEDDVGVEAGAVRTTVEDAENRQCRITSYNVCYTKLLRAVPVHAIENDLARAPILHLPGPVDGSLLAGAAPVECLRSVSYNAGLMKRQISHII